MEQNQTDFLKTKQLLDGFGIISIINFENNEIEFSPDNVMRIKFIFNDAGKFINIEYGTVF